MFRSIIFIFTFLGMASSVSAGVVVDGKVAFLASQAAEKADGPEVFAGSIRFAFQPGSAEMDVLADLGVEFFDHGNGPVGSRTVFPVRIPFSALETLEKLEFLIAIDSAWHPDSPPPLPRSRPQVEADQVWQVVSPLGGTLSGKGVTICDIDTGVDYLHPVFFKLSGEVFNWLDVDQSGDLTPGDLVDLNDNDAADPGEDLLYRESDNTDHYGNDPTRYDAGFDFLYNDANGSGTREYGPPAFGESDPCYGELVFLSDDVNGNGLLDPGESLLGLDQSKVRAIYNRDGTVYRRGVDLLDSERDTWGHGTQVMGIFGGGWAGHHEMTGMAPGVESLQVNYDFAAEPPFLIPIEAGLAWAVGEGADIVLIEDGEWVWEYLDGSSNLEIMINEYAADEGIIFILPAGTLAAGHMHTHFNSSQVEVLNAFNNITVLWPSFLSANEPAMELILTPPNGIPVTLAGIGGTLVTQGYRIYDIVSVSPRGTRRHDIRISSQTQGGPINGYWTFQFSGPPVDVHGYFGGDDFSWFSNSTWIHHEEEAYTVTWPATADSAISVAAYAPDGDGDIDFYSGWGPRHDGRPDVDIAAPGAYVWSAHPFIPGDFSAFSGTSGAGPHVAGAAALLKELVPDLDNGWCRWLLHDGAGQDAFTGDPDRWGAGKLRIYAAISSLLSDVADEPRHPGLQMAAHPNPFNPTTTIRFNLPAVSGAQLRIFDVSGREVWSRTIDPGQAGWREVTWNGKDENGLFLSSGMYFAHVVQGAHYAVTKVTLVK